MTEVEDTLVRVLTAEADRHEPPLFDARRIAEGAARRPLWRRPLFSVVAGAIAVAGGGGAAVFAAASGGHPSGSRVTVTFRNDAFAHLPIPIMDTDVSGWVRQTIAAEGLKDTSVFLNNNPVELVVQGRAADLPKLKALLGTPVVLQFREAGFIPTTSNPQCKMSTTEDGSGPRNGPRNWPTNAAGDSLWLACDRHDPHYIGVSSLEVIDYHTVWAQAEAPVPGAGASATGWRVAVRLDPMSAGMLAGVARNGGTIAAMVDGMVHDQWNARRLNAYGVLTIDGTYTEKEAKDLAARLANQGPPGVEGTKVTVTR